MEKVYVCAIKVLGFPFAVLTEEEAKRWVNYDPVMNYYDVVPIKKLETV